MKIICDQCQAEINPQRDDYRVVEVDYDERLGLINTYVHGKCELAWRVKRQKRIASQQHEGDEQLPLF